MEGGLLAPSLGNAKTEDYPGCCLLGLLQHSY